MITDLLSLCITTQSVVLWWDCNRTEQQRLRLTSSGKESVYNAGDPGSIPGSGRPSGEGIGYPLQYSWSSEKAMAPHSSTLAWKIPWMEEPGRLQSMGSLRVRHDWATSLSLLTFMHWRRKWQPTPVFLPGESRDGEPGRLLSLGSHRVRHDWSNLAAAAVAAFLVFPCGSAGKESACNAGDLSSIPGWGRSPGKGKGYPLQYSGLENIMDYTVHGVTKSQTQLSDFHFLVETFDNKQTFKGIYTHKMFKTVPGKE